MIGAFRTAALLAIVAIAVLLAVTTRHLLDMALVLLPLIVSSLPDGAGRSRCGCSSTSPTSSRCRCCSGVGVSFNVYFVMNWRARRSAPLGSATARAVLFSALTTATAFGSLALSQHPGTASMGRLLLLSLGCTLLTTMVFLPALLAWLGNPAVALRANGSAPCGRARRWASMADVRALVFDVFGTVVDWRGGVAREAAPFLARHAPGADPAAFADAWRRQYQPAMEEVRSGQRPFTRLDVLHRENLDGHPAGLRHRRARAGRPSSMR